MDDHHPSRGLLVSRDTAGVVRLTLNRPEKRNALSHALLGELDEAMKAARASKTGAYIEIIGGRLDMPPALAFAHGRLKAMYGDAP